MKLVKQVAFSWVHSKTGLIPHLLQFVGSKKKNLDFIALTCNSQSSCVWSNLLNYWVVNLAKFALCLLLRWRSLKYAGLKSPNSFGKELAQEPKIFQCKSINLRFQTKLLKACVSRSARGIMRIFWRLVCSIIQKMHFFKLVCHFPASPHTLQN